MHDFAQNRRPVAKSSKRGKSRSLMVIAGLLLVSVGAKHLAEKGEGPVPMESVAQSEPAAKEVSVNTSQVALEPTARPAHNSRVVTKSDGLVSEASATPNSLLKKIVGEANGAGFEFYDMLKHAWPQANDLVTEVKESQLNDQSAFLQVASYREVDDAEKLRKKLVGMGLDATIETGGSDSGARWFRVFVGPFSNEAKLKKAENALAKMNFSPVPSTR